MVSEPGTPDAVVSAVVAAFAEVAEVAEPDADVLSWGVAGEAAACMPSEATRPLETAITAPALATGPAESCGRACGMRPSEGVNPGVVDAALGARWRPVERDVKAGPLRRLRGELSGSGGSSPGVVPVATRTTAAHFTPRMSATIR